MACYGRKKSQIRRRKKQDSNLFNLNPNQNSKTFVIGKGFLTKNRLLDSEEDEDDLFDLF